MNRSALENQHGRFVKFRFAFLLAMRVAQAANMAATNPNP
jgi:hypothetical protein